MRYDRYKQVDFLHPWLVEPTVLLIPPPVSTIKLSAIWNPFDFIVFANYEKQMLFLSNALFILFSQGLDCHIYQRFYNHGSFSAFGSI